MTLKPTKRNNFNSPNNLDYRNNPANPNNSNNPNDSTPIIVRQGAQVQDTLLQLREGRFSGYVSRLEVGEGGFSAV